MTNDPRLLEAFGVKSVDSADMDAILVEEVQKGGMVFPIQDFDGEIRFLSEDSSDAGIIGYAVMSPQQITDQDRRIDVFHHLQTSIEPELQSFVMEGNTLECEVTHPNGDIYVRGPYGSLQEALADIALEFSDQL